MKIYCTLVKIVKLNYLVPIDKLILEIKQEFVSSYSFALHQCNVKYPGIDIKTLIRRHLTRRFKRLLKRWKLPSPRVQGLHTMQSRMATFASSITLVVFNLVKIVKHQWIELFCFLINKFIYCKQQQNDWHMLCYLLGYILSVNNFIMQIRKALAKSTFTSKIDSPEVRRCE